jgi:hypothetical protein
VRRLAPALALALLPGCCTFAVVDAMETRDPWLRGRPEASRTLQAAALPVAVVVDAATLPVQAPVLVGLWLWLSNASWSF